MRHIALLIISLLFLTITQAQRPDTTYEKRWREIDSLNFKQNLTRSALDKVNVIYSEAKKKGQNVQLIKALLYRLQLEERITDKDPNKNINLLISEAATIKDVATKSILYSLVAQKYKTYFENNRYRFYNRSTTVGFKKEDVATWSADDFNAAITKWFQQSLADAPALQRINIRSFEPILTYSNTQVFRPTLYDLLAQRALSYFMSDETYITKPLYAFTINASALSRLDEFVGHAFTTRDFASNKWKALLLFQDLVRFHQQHKDTAALIDVNLQRLQFARGNGNITNEDSLYYDAVQETAKRFSANRYSAQAWFLLAQWHAEKAGRYNANGDTSNRWQYTKALEIAMRFLPLKDSTEGHYNLFNLYNSINQKNINLQTEQVNVPTLPFRTLVTYRNVQTLYYRIIKSTKAVDDTIEKHPAYNSKGLSTIAKDFAYLTQQKVSLPVTSDYQSHSVEIKIDPLPVGSYYMLASTNPNFSDTTKLAWQNFHVSDISYVNNGQHYFVLNRTTGKPLINARVQVWDYVYTNRSSKYEKKESYLIDANGYFALQAKKNERNIQLEISTGDDHLFIKNGQYVYALQYNRNESEGDKEDYEESNAKVYFFTDRSIYRPGQVVYYKMLALTKDYKTKKPKLITTIPGDEKNYLYLQDANDKNVDSVLIKLNDYGSFAGSFKLPLNVLTGEFKITTEEGGRETGGNFSVEEYKRPTFYVELEKPKGSYRLNDSLTVTGKVKAYAGNSIDGANVKYRVTRRGRFLYPWRWYRQPGPSSAEMTMTFGEAKTDANGNFTIKFAALPDADINKDLLPIFDFVINADVTDAAGETRSSDVTVSAGYHSLNIKLNVKETAEADSLKTLFVSTTNIAGDKEPANVKVTISALQSPQHLIRKRYWQQADQFLYSYAEYQKYFPNDEYKDESDKNTWVKSTPVFSISVNTKENEKVNIPAGLLKAGWYIVEATTKDKDGNEIKDTKYLQLFSKNEGEFKGNSYLFTSLINNVSPPGVPASFLIGSSASDIHLIQETQRKPNAKTNLVRSEFTFHSIDRAVKEITVTPTIADIGGMGVNFVFVKDNRIYTWNQSPVVNEERNDLNIDVITYRNKLEPGNQEKWTVKVSGKNKEAAAAEVLTSMYDASLDQFKSHSWQLPVFDEPRFYGNGWDNNNGFTQVGSTENNTAVENKYYWKQYADIDVYLDAYNDRLKFMMLPRAGGEMLQGRLAGVNISDASLEEVVVTGYGTAKKASMARPIVIRGSASIPAGSQPLYVLDGKIVEGMGDINPADIINTEILKDAAATAIYGARGANGVILITTRNGAANKPEEPVIKVRTNFNETAFFYPQLRTDKEGNLSFTFTLPEALTQWKWQVFAHNKSAEAGLIQKTIVSQKTLMVQTNAPRFLREGDKIELSVKISNLSTGVLNGQATLQLIDATTNEPVDGIFSNQTSSKKFSIDANQSTAIFFTVAVPANFAKPLIWRIVAKAGSFGDGEENTLPVLTNRMLVTESLPLYVRGSATKQFEFTKLKNQQSATLQHQSLTVEYTSNPVWYAIQSLPYLIEFPYECSEQTFNRVFANALGSRIVNSNPRIEQVFELWKKDTAALLTNLQKNEELKNILLQETPWVLQAESETQQKRNVALLFDAIKMSQSLKSNIEKLEQMQLESGGFTWFKGAREDRYITQYIVTGIGRLQRMQAIPADQQQALLGIATKAIQYLDEEINDDYKDLIKYKADLKKNNIGPIQIQYLYMRSFFTNDKVGTKTQTAYNFYYQQAKQFWVEQNTYFKAMTGIALYRNNERRFVNVNILKAILENALEDKDAGIHWKDNQRGFYWYEAPVEQQALIMEFVNDVYQQEKITDLIGKLDDMKKWLLRQKQTNHWNTTKATADACYALLLQGNDWLQDKQVAIKLGDVTISSNDKKTEAGTGYFKQKIDGDKVQSLMGNISVTTATTNQPVNSSTSQSTAPSWGAVYWQYFEDIDKITASATPLSINKKLFIERNTNKGPVLSLVNNGDQLKVGDKIKVRIEIRSDRNMEYVHLKDMRAASMEPVNVLSSYKYQDGLGYYEATKDAATNFFFSTLPKGTYVFEYPLFITHSGNFSVGVASAQCMYAPEFTSYSEGIRVSVEAQ